MTGLANGEKMSEENKNSILLVDDDPAFRKTVTTLLNTLKLSVIQAGSTQEANKIISKGEPALAIVDYNLPDGDGMTLISEMRAAGKKMPIVFVSASFCDAKTFNSLRNLLKVSLVLQKPIAPDLLLQQLDGILPFASITNPTLPILNPDSAAVKAAKTGNLAGALSSVHKEYDKLVKELPAAKQKFDEALDSESRTSEVWLLSKLKQIAQKARVENALAATKTDYLRQLPGLWLGLSKNLASLRENPADQNLKNQLINETHKLRGAAGTLGLSDVGREAGEIEERLRILQSTFGKAQENIWTEIITAQKKGENLISKASNENGKEKVETQTVKECNLLLFTKDPILRQKINAMPSMQPYQFYYADTTADALLFAKTMPLAGLIFDLRSKLDQGYFQICKELRQSPGSGCLPFMAITSENDRKNADEMAYLGFSCQVNAETSSAKIDTFIDEKPFAQAVQKLLHIQQLTRSRVLLVDDDTTLCQFISAVLQGADMVCECLTEPINILEKLERFQPDIVLLDVLMPGLSGYDVCRLLRANPAWQDLVIIFLTVRQDAQGRMAAFIAGGDDFFTKPVVGEELILRVKNHLERSRVKQRRTEAEDLTGYPMRKAYLNDLQKICTPAASKGNCGCVCMLEISNFDQIGEQKGFAGQDYVLEQLGSLLKSRFKSEVKRGRFSDKVFLITFPNSDKASVSCLMEMFNLEFNAATQASPLDKPRPDKKGQSLNATLTWALAEFPTEANNASGIVELLSGRLALARKETMSAGAKT